jgi:hypothetical protein
VNVASGPSSVRRTQPCPRSGEGERDAAPVEVLECGLEVLADEEALARLALKDEGHDEGSKGSQLELEIASAPSRCRWLADCRAAKVATPPRTTTPACQ